MCYPPTFTLSLLLFALFLGCRCLPDRSAIAFDLTNLNLVCPGLDSCRDKRYWDSLRSYNCHCGSFCRDIDTCCLDSPFRSTSGQEPRFSSKCLGVYGRTDYIMMVDECWRGWRDDEDEGFVRYMCSTSGHDTDDPFLTVPVTSQRTGITYKNYYCAVCNENPQDGQVTFWNVEVESKTQILSNASDLDLKYDWIQQTWTTELVEGFSIPVTLTMKEPDSVRQKVKNCRSSGQQVSECAPDWTDRSTAEKCWAYTALVSTNIDGHFVRYKNPHCALCNFEQPYSVDCWDREGGVSAVSGVPFAGGVSKTTFFVGLFILEDDAEVKTKTKKCDLGQVYDGLAKKCRTIRCPKARVLRNRKCVPIHPPVPIRPL